MKQSRRVEYTMDMRVVARDVSVTSLNITELTPDDVLPYGVFLSGVPVLLPPGSPGGDPDLWTLRDDVTYVAADGTVIALKAGETSDLASTPDWTKILWGGAGRETVASVFHDWGWGHLTTPLYNIFTKAWWTPPRAWHDACFWNLMSMFKTPWLRKNCFWAAVRGWGRIKDWWLSFSTKE